MRPACSSLTLVAIGAIFLFAGQAAIAQTGPKAFSKCNVVIHDLDDRYAKDWLYEYDLNGNLIQDFEVPAIPSIYGGDFLLGGGIVGMGVLAGILPARQPTTPENSFGIAVIDSINRSSAIFTQSGTQSQNLVPSALTRMDQYVFALDYTPVRTTFPLKSTPRSIIRFNTANAAATAGERIPIGDANYPWAIDYFAGTLYLAESPFNATGATGIKIRKFNPLTKAEIAPALTVQTATFPPGAKTAASKYRNLIGMAVFSEGIYLAFVETFNTKSHLLKISPTTGAVIKAIEVPGLISVPQIRPDGVLVFVLTTNTSSKYTKKIGITDPSLAAPIYKTIKPAGALPLAGSHPPTIDFVGQLVGDTCAGRTNDCSC